MNEIMRDGTVLSFAGVTGRKRKFHLTNINMELQPGYIYGLMGENGAGKTTLMKYILNEYCRYDGKIYIDGEDISIDHAKIMNKVGYVSEDNHFFEARTGAQNANMLGILYDDFSMDRFKEAMEQVGLSAAKVYKGMSRGERLKFQLAFAIAHKPSIYLLDEVTVGMDPVFRLDFFEILRNLIKDEECAVLMTSHIQSEIEMKTDYVAVMKDGRLGEFMESLDMDQYEREADQSE